MKQILLTGFEPFHDDLINPSQEIAVALDGRRLGGATVVGRVLPCAFGMAWTELARLLREHRPDAVLCLGQSGGRDKINPERVALNVDDAPYPDNAGRAPVDRPIVPRGPAAYWSTLPNKAIVAALEAAGIPAAVSSTAGTFVCNHVFYQLMHALARRRPAAGVSVPRAGFMHLPYTPAQAQLRAGKPSLPLTTMIEATELALTVVARPPRTRTTRAPCRVSY